MNVHRITNWLLAIAIVLIYALMQTLDGPSDHSAEHAQALALLDAQRTEAAELRFAHAAAAVCGPNAAAQDLGNGMVQCMTHKGRKTVQVAL